MFRSRGLTTGVLLGLLASTVAPCLALCLPEPAPRVASCHEDAELGQPVDGRLSPACCLADDARNQERNPEPVQRLTKQVSEAGPAPETLGSDSPGVAFHHVSLSHRTSLPPPVRHLPLLI